MDTVLSKKEQLIVSLLFSNKIVYDINIEEYSQAECRSDFRDEIRTILKRSGIVITEDRIVHKDEKIIWKIEIKK